MRWIRQAYGTVWNNRKSFFIGLAGTTVVTGYLMLYQNRVFREFWQVEACRMDFFLTLPVQAAYGIPFLLFTGGSCGQTLYSEQLITRFVSRRAWWMYCLLVVLSGVLACSSASCVLALIPVCMDCSCNMNWDANDSLMILYTGLGFSGKETAGELLFIGGTVILGYLSGVGAVSVIQLTIRYLSGSSVCSFAAGVAVLYMDRFLGERAILFPKAEMYYQGILNGRIGNILWRQLVVFCCVAAWSVWIGGRKKDIL